MELVIRIAICLLLVGIFTLFHLEASTAAKIGSINHVDGAFQTNSALTRLCLGELPGRDFDLYLGFGPIILNLPLFVINGCDLQASMYSAVFMTNAALFTTVFTLFYLSFSTIAKRNVGFFYVIILAVAIFIVLKSTSGDPKGWGLTNQLESPGNSLLMLRYLTPVIAALAILFLWNRPFWMGTVIGSLIWYSIDTGIPTTLLACIAFPIFQKNNIRFFGGVTVGTLTALIISTSGHIWSVFEFRSQMSTSQFFYFTPFSDAAKYYDLKALLIWFNRDSAELTMALFITPLLILSTFFWKTPRKYTFCWLVLIGGIYGGAGISEFGGHISDRYWSATVLAFPFLLATAIGTGIFNNIKLGSTFEVIGNLPKSPIYSVGGVGTVVLAGFCIVNYYLDLKRHDQRINARLVNLVYHSSLGSSLSANDSGDLDFEFNGRPFLSTYYNAFNSHTKSHSELRVDSLIHAFGSEKEAWVNAAGSREYDRIFTTRADYNIWSTWLHRADWPFFRQVLLNYASGKTGASIQEWTLRDKVIDDREPLDCLVRPFQDKLIVTVSTPDVESLILADVFLTPSVDFEKGILPINGSRGIVTVRGSNFFEFGNPINTSFSFPVLVTEGRTSVSVLSFPQDRTSFADSKCEAVNLKIAEEDVIKMYGVPRGYLQAGEISDTNWALGISTKRAGFYTLSANLRNVEVGDFLIFNDAGRRKVEVVNRRGQYTNIFVEGEILDPVGNGYPNLIKLEKPE